MLAFSPFDSLLRIVTGHVVSSPSMASRAYLTDSRRAVVVRASDGGLWLASTLDALGPDEEALIRRGEEVGGPPAQYARTALVKITIEWGGLPGRPESREEVQIANPRVVKNPGGASLAAVPLGKSRDLIGMIAEGRGPTPIDVSSKTAASVDDAVRLDEDVSVATLFRADDGGYWPLQRRARISSEPGVDFLGESGAAALDLELQPSDAGSAVFGGPALGGAFIGLARPVGPGVAMLLPPGFIGETIG